MITAFIIIINVPILLLCPILAMMNFFIQSYLSSAILINCQSSKKWCCAVFYYMQQNACNLFITGCCSTCLWIQCSWLFPVQYLFVFVERVYDELHHAINFRLECMLFRLLMQFLHLCHTHAIQLDRLLLPVHTFTHMRYMLMKQITGIIAHCC